MRECVSVFVCMCKVLRDDGLWKTFAVSSFILKSYKVTKSLL